MQSANLCPGFQETSRLSLQEQCISSPRKRRRTSLACTSCRRKKSKCDGQRPTCSSCLDLQISCIYEEPPKQNAKRCELINKRPQIQSRPNDNGIIVEIGVQGRVQTAVSEMVPKCAFRPIAMSDVTTGEVTTAISYYPGSTIVTQDSANPPDSSTASTTSAVTSHEVAVDTLATGAFDGVSKHDIGYFGPTSNHALFRSLSNVFEQFSRQSFPLRQHSMSKFNKPNYEVTQRLSARSTDVQSPRILDIKPRPNDLHAIPDEQDLVLLTNQFFSTVGLTLPIINKSAVLPQNSRPREPLSRPKLALINVVCAYALSTLRSQNAEMFYRRGLSLLDERTLRGSSLELVQVLLLLSSFQQNNQRSVASWTLHATAVKVAFQLGLHSPVIYEAYGSQDSELRKRVWYAVINQDRSLTASLGRPCLIPSQHIRVQQSQNSPSIGDTLPLATQEEIDSLLYFNQTISLNAIKNSTIEILYDYNIESSTLFTLDELIIKRVQISSKLSKWRENLPQSCNILSDTDFGTWTLQSYNTNRFNLFFSIQYYGLLLLINSPILTRLLQEGMKEQQRKGETTLLLEIMIPMIKNDLVAAKELQKLIHAAVTCSDTFLDCNAAWWMCNYTIFTVNLHLFGILLACKTSDVGDLEMADIRASLDSGLETLRLVGRASLMSRKAGDCLLGFLEVFDSLTSEPPQQNDEKENLAETSTPLPSALLSWNLMPENFCSQYIAESMDDFFLHCSDNALLDADSGFFQNWN